MLGLGPFLSIPNEESLYIKACSKYENFVLKGEDEMKKFEEMLSKLEFSSGEEKDKLNVISILRSAVFSDYFDPKIKNKIEERMENIEEIDLSGMKKLLTKESIYQIIKVCKKLKIINFQGCQLIDDDVINNLSCLDLKVLKVNESLVSDNSISNISRFHHLTHLDLSFCQYISDVSFEILLQSNLEFLSVKNCEKVTSKIFPFLLTGISIFFYLNIVIYFYFQLFFLLIIFYI